MQMKFPQLLFRQEYHSSSASSSFCNREKEKVESVAPGNAEEWFWFSKDHFVCMRTPVPDGKTRRKRNCDFLEIFFWSTDHEMKTRFLCGIMSRRTRNLEKKDTIVSRLALSFHFFSEIHFSKLESSVSPTNGLRASVLTRASTQKKKLSPKKKIRRETLSCYYFSWKGKRRHVCCPKVF